MVFHAFPGAFRSIGSMWKISLFVNNPARFRL